MMTSPARLTETWQEVINNTDPLADPRTRRINSGIEEGIVGILVYSFYHLAVHFLGHYYYGVRMVLSVGSSPGPLEKHAIKRRESENMGR
ncbi:unnamed protein product [Linum trigynum]|uniref:Uncharacterized protein n=1 Tax=Linum trigynum TaxID=586398 RepID=A0AAV2CCK4_9ROSI